MQNKKLRAAIVGAGYIASYHIEAVNRDRDAQLVAICDLRRPAAEALVSGDANVKVYTRYDEMLSSENPDVVHVLTQPDSHFELTRSALEAGCHVILEKPATTSSAEANEIAQLASQSNLQVAINHNFIFSRPFLKLVSAINNGDLGPLKSVRIVWKKPLPQIVSGPWHLWMLRSPENVLFETGSHSVSELLSVMDESPEVLNVYPRRSKKLNSGVDFYRRWNIFGMMGETSVQIDIAYDQGYEQHFVEVEGVFAVARADIENDVFTIDQPTGREYEFERLGINLREGMSRARQAISTFSSYVGSKFLGRFSGAPYRSSMLNGIASCYDQLRLHDSARRETGIEFAIEVANCLENIQEKIPSRIIENSIEPSLEPSPDESPLENADILIIGATGFIGKCLLTKLLKEGKKVRVLVRNPSFLSDANITEDFEYVIGDFRDEAAVSKALQGVSVVIHLAVSHGKSLDGYLRQDSDPTIRLAEICRDLGIKRFIYTGTIDSLALSSPGALRESDGTDQKIKRRNNYAHSKAITEDRLNAMHRQNQFPVVIIRPAIVLGTGGSPLHVGVAKWSGIGRCEFWGRGSNFLPLVLVDDVCDAIVNAVDADGIEGKTYNLSSDSCVSAREYVEQVENVLGYSVKQKNVSALSNFGADFTKWIVKFMVGHPDKTRIPSLHDWKCREQLAHFDTTAAQNDLSWRPTQDRDRIVREGIVEPTKLFLNNM